MEQTRPVLTADAVAFALDLATYEVGNGDRATGHETDLAYAAAWLSARESGQSLNRQEIVRQIAALLSYSAREHSLDTRLWEPASWLHTAELIVSLTVPQEHARAKTAAATAAQSALSAALGPVKDKWEDHSSGDDIIEDLQRVIDRAPAGIAEQILLAFHGQLAKGGAL